MTRQPHTQGGASERDVDLDGAVPRKSGEGMGVLDLVALVIGGNRSCHLLTGNELAEKTQSPGQTRAGVLLKLQLRLKTST